ncbi:MAG: hypothetical protein AAGK04_08135 [Planctomycetota bacterium]
MIGSHSASAQDAYAEATPSKPAYTLDYIVRGDFFQGLLQGDEEAWTRARQNIEARLEESADDGEALAWHGSMLIADAGDAFLEGDEARGIELWTRGHELMDRGVTLDGGTVNTLIPRGVTLMQVHQYEIDSDRAAHMLDTAVDDLSASLEFLSRVWENQSPHAQGMLLLMLADAREQRAQLDQQRSHALRQRVVNELPGTTFAARARAAMADARPAAVPNADQQAAAPANKEAVLSTWLMGVIRMDDTEERVAASLLSDLEMGLGGNDAAWSRAGAILDGIEGNAAPAMLGLSGFYRVMQSGRLFEAARFQEAIPMWRSGMASLEDLAASHPNSRSARACRATTYLMVHMHERDPSRAREMLQAAKVDTTDVAQWLNGEMADPSLRAGAALASGLVLQAQEDEQAALAQFKAAADVGPRSLAGRLAASMSR